MKGDFTRFSHQPHRHYSGVLMQQGRVTLDADWNEQLEIEDHRWRVQTMDTIGRACAPVDNPGFGLSLTPDGSDIIISSGRIYVDGILVEIHDGTAVGIESIDAETMIVRDVTPDDDRFAAGQWVELSSDDRPAVLVTQVVTVDLAASRVELADDISAFDGDAGLVVRRLTTYLTQPFFAPDAAPPFGDLFDPAGWAGQTHLVYLDVWRRHVTAIEDPHIREVALGGPDTATRVQTAWALRILRDPDRQGEPADAGGIGCADDLQLWDELTAPPLGRASAAAAAAPDALDPCAIEPDAGYRGLENRLYRLEIHQSGDLGVATFKWSRDNGSILSSIVGFPDVDEVDVHSLGKDKVLRFRADDRVEVLSDESEFAGLAGTMASIIGAPDEAERRISLDTDVSAFQAHTRPRIRRWDHGAGEIPTGAGPIDLEDGVQVEFSGGPFRAGDYWLIPARVATGDVEGFIDAPPRGIDHSYARVALVTWPAAGAGSMLDCRHTFPPLCEIEPGGGQPCCTVSVGDGGDFATLQEAVDAVAQVDGPARICVLPGEHRLSDTVIVARSDLTISGCGRRSRVVATEGGAVVLRSVSEVRIEDLWIFSSSTQATITALESRTIEVVDCRVINGGRTDRRPADDLVAPTHNPFGRPADLAPSDEVDREDVPVAALNDDPWLAAAITVPRSAGPAIATAQCRFVKIRDSVVRGLPALDLQGEYMWVEQNVITGGGVWLREGTDTAVIAHNTISRGHGQGVLLGGLRPNEDLIADRSGVHGIEVASNHIELMAREGISSNIFDDERLGDIDELTIEGNDISQCGIAPIVEGFGMGGGIFIRDGSAVRIHDNTIVNNGPVEGSQEIFGIGFGIAVVMCIGLDVQGNRIEENGRTHGPGDEGFNLNAGIAALGVFSTERIIADVPTVDGPAATIQGNVISSAEGPGVVAFGLGPISIDDNDITCHYPGRGLLDIGRAIIVVNLGGAPDIGAVQYGLRQVAWPLRHGRVSLHSNQVTVHASASGLPAFNPDLDPDKSAVGDMQQGSAIAVMSFDDVMIGANQVLNELTPIGQGFGRIHSSVWALASTIRSTTNRVTELPRTTLRSYVGAGYAHNASDNITTHCVRVDGTRKVNRDNIELLCERFELAPANYHVMYGG